MRVLSRIALLLVIVSAPSLVADHFIANCPLSLADATPAATDFDLSPHGVFRFGSNVFALRGNVLTTYTVNDAGNLIVARNDFIASLGARETEGGTAFSNGFLFLSSEAGLEIYDLRNTRAGGTAPVLVTRVGGLHYRRLAANGTRLAGLYPATDLPCYPNTTLCQNSIDIFDISTISSPAFIASISSRVPRLHLGFNDIAFNQGHLLAVSEVGLSAYDVHNGSPAEVAFIAHPGKFLISNGTIAGVGNDLTIHIIAVRPGLAPFFSLRLLVTAPQYLTIDRENGIRFHRQGWYDEASNRLVTMIDEINPLNLQPARTIAFNVYDFDVPFFEGAAERIYEEMTLTTDDEVKHNPVMVGPYIYVVGERTGIQSYGACGAMTGKIELDSINHLTCNGAALHGWVTGTQKIVNVELFLDATSLGAATLTATNRLDISSKTPVSGWRININLDNTPRGEHLLRAVGTDILGVRRQFASKRIFFPGAPNNCTIPRRRAVR